MKKRGIKTTPATYTSLFNACANSPYKDDALKRAKHLHNLMSLKSIEPNIFIYHAMIKGIENLKLFKYLEFKLNSLLSTDRVLNRNVLAFVKFKLKIPICHLIMTLCPIN